jgi:lipopolysaccharide biosynthesis glycosyltransferase
MTKAPFYPNTVPVCFASNDFFAPYMAAMMRSIMENANPARRYAFFVLHRDLTRETIALLREQTALFPNFSLDCIDVGELVKGYHFWTANRETITAETYFRLLIPALFAAYEKVVYLDGDMICLADIAALYDIDIGSSLLASTRDALGAHGYYSEKNKKKREARYLALSFKNHDDYFIAGTIVFNIKEFSRKVTLDELLAFAVSREWTCHDQDILNVLCEGRVKFVPLQWDFSHIADISFLPDYWQKEYTEAKQEPKIIHFAARAKPWKQICYIPYFECFWKYATRTPFIETITQRMKTYPSLGEGILSNIKHREGISLRFLFECLWTWIGRDKK